MYQELSLLEDFVQTYGRIKWKQTFCSCKEYLWWFELLWSSTFESSSLKRSNSLELSELRTVHILARHFHIVMRLMLMTKHLQRWWGTSTYWCWLEAMEPLHLRQEMEFGKRRESTKAPGTGKRRMKMCSDSRTRSVKEWIKWSTDSKEWWHFEYRTKF